MVEAIAAAAVGDSCSGSRPRETHRNTAERGAVGRHHLPADACWCCGGGKYRNLPHAASVCGDTEDMAGRLNRHVENSNARQSCSIGTPVRTPVFRGINADISSRK